MDICHSHYSSTPFLHSSVSRAVWLVSLTALLLLVLMAIYHQGSSLSPSVRSCSFSPLRQKPEPQSATCLPAFLHLELCTSAFSAFSPGNTQWIHLLQETLNDCSHKTYKVVWWNIRQIIHFMHSFLIYAFLIMHSSFLIPLEFLSSCYVP